MRDLRVTPSGEVLLSLVVDRPYVDAVWSLRESWGLLLDFKVESDDESG
jgi:hypothetical protein